MKKFKIILPAVCVSAIVPSIGLSLSACGGQTTTHIVQPTQQEKTKEPDAGVTTATFIIQMNEEVDKSLLSVEVKDESLKTNANSLKASITNSKDKKCYVDVTWINEPEATITCTFTLVLTKKDSWTEKVEKCSLKYTKSEPTIVHVTGVTLNKETTSIIVGKTETLTATVAPEDATDKSVKWTSSDESVAKVDENGVVSAIKAGTSTITVTTNDQEKTATCEVTVTEEVIHVTGVTLNKSTASIVQGSSETLTATVAPEDATDKSVKWTSSDTTVATVTNGVVNALKVGTSTITVTTNDQAKTATCVVTVTSSVVHVTGVTLNKSTTSIVEGSSETLTATVAPEDATDKSVTWESSDTSVATVTNGVVNALKVGTSTITVKTNDQAKTATCVVTVTSSVTSVSVTGEHNIDINSSSISFKAYDQSKTKEITSGCTFAIAPSTLGTFTNNTLALSDTAKKQGGSATITAKHTESGKTSASFEIEIATFDKLVSDGTEYSLQNGYAKSVSTATGLVVLPTRYYVDDTTTWKNTTQIAASSMNAPGITGIYISKSISFIGGQAFGTSLEEIDVDTNNATYSCPTDSNCIIKTSTKELTNGCKNTVIPTDSTKVTSIGSSAFINVQFTTPAITIPSNILTIGYQSFYNSNITGVTFAGTSTLTTIDQLAFANCTSLTGITIPASVNKIGVEAFKNCGDTFASATFANTTNTWIQTGDTEKTTLTITNASDNATHLKDCTTGTPITDHWGTTGIEISTSIEINEIGGTITSHNITVGKGTGTIQCKAKIVGGVDITDLCKWEIDDKNFGSFSEETKGKLVLKDDAFKKGSFTKIKATYLTSVAEFEASFCDWTKLDEASLAEGKAKVKADTTTGDVAIPQKYHNGSAWKDITTIENKAFSTTSTGISSLHIPSTVTSIGSEVFYGNSSLTEITVDSGNTTYKSINDNCVVKTSDKKLVLAAKGSSIPDDADVCTGIASGVFSGQTFTSSASSTLSIPSNINTLEPGAFKNIKYVGTIDLSESSVTVIPDNAFDASDITTSSTASSSNLSAVKLSASTTSIGAEAFKNCIYLSSITIPSGVTSIGSNAFSGCTYLKTIDVSAFESVPSSLWTGTIFSGLPTSGGKVKIKDADLASEWKTLLESLGLPSTGWTYTTE